MHILDCTLRDGGYYNGWDFPPSLVSDYLGAMHAVGVDIVEVGFRSLRNNGFYGPFAYSTEDFLKDLCIPDGLKVAVMVNASELLGEHGSLESVLERLFPVMASYSAVQVVRIACHAQEFASVLPASEWLKARGYIVGLNLMQVADRSQDEVEEIAMMASRYPLDVLYFADSSGSMTPNKIFEVVGWLRKYWQGELGIHTHDNMGQALQNTLRASDKGVTWLDSTVTGMGRGPGNARTEELIIEISERLGKPCTLLPLMTIIRKYFRPLQHQFGWGTNPYYYLTGKYGIHPTYIQEMLSDSRYSDEDIYAVIEYLRIEGGKKFSLDTLDAARHFYQGPPRGNWSPISLFKGREVLLLGTGPGVASHCAEIERYIRKTKPLVMALNTQSSIAPELIDVRVACHPVRLLADCDIHSKLPQPLITPASMLPEDVRASLAGKQLLDYGLTVQAGKFEFSEYFCTLPTSLVIAYALAVSTSGHASRILMAGFDGYGGDDPRTTEMQNLLTTYRKCGAGLELIAITPTRYTIPTISIYYMGVP